MRSNLEVPNGIFDPRRRFAFTNILKNEDFVSAWGGNPIRIGPLKTVELPHYLAVKLTMELVDKIMIEGIKDEEVKNGGGNAYYRSPKGSSLGVPAARKVYEDQILKELEVNEDSPEVQVLRAQIKEEVTRDLQGANEPTPSDIPLPVSAEEFADLNKSPEATVELRKRGRPAKAKEVSIT